MAVERGPPPPPGRVSTGTELNTRLQPPKQLPNSDTRGQRERRGSGEEGWRAHLAVRLLELAVACAGLDAEEVVELRLTNHVLRGVDDERGGERGERRMRDRGEERSEGGARAGRTTGGGSAMSFVEQSEPVLDAPKQWAGRVRRTSLSQLRSASFSPSPRPRPPSSRADWRGTEKLHDYVTGWIRALAPLSAEVRPSSPGEETDRSTARSSLLTTAREPTCRLFRASMSSRTTTRATRPPPRPRRARPR